MGKKKTGLDNVRRQRISDRVLVLTLFVQTLILVNQTVALYGTAAQTMQASITEPKGESLKIHIETDTGRLNLVEKILRHANDWVGSYYVSSIEKTQTTLGVSITVTGSNVDNGAKVSYYIKAVDNADAGNWHKTLDEVNQSITVGGSALVDDVTKDIGQHLADIGLSTTESHTVKYYIWIEARTNGTISGEPLTCTVAETLFDTITYTYESLPVETTIYSDKDSFITNMDSHSAVNYGTDDFLQVNQMNGGPSAWAIIGWDISGLPESATIQDADVSIYSKYSDNHNIYVWRITESWIESTVTYNNQPSYTTSQESVVYQPDAEGWKSWDITDQFTTAYNGGSGTEYTAYFRSAQYGSDKYDYFYSSDKNAAYKPQLALTYLAYSASWYPLPPMSLAALPVTIDVVAMVALIMATLYTFERRRKNI